MIHRFTGPTVALIVAMASAPLAHAQETAELAIEGSSGMYFTEQAAACQAAQADAASAAERECTRKEGTASEPVLAECSCEQGGFEGAEWLCSSKATLTCTVGKKEAPKKPVPPSAGPAVVDFSVPSTLTALEMLEVDFARRGRTIPRGSIAERYKAMCEGGWALACEASSWHEDGMSSLDKASVAVTRACEGGDTAACVAEGWAHEAVAQRTGDENEYKAAARRYKALCDSEKNQYACYEYGAILFNNLGVTADPRLGVRRWEEACKEKEGAACTALARVYRDGARIKAEPAKAKDFAKKACDAGDPFGCVEVARGEGDEKLVSRLSELCQKGGMSACWELASSYVSGERTEPSKGMARSLLDMGCSLGHGPSCSSAASAALADGEEAVAARLYRQACRAGDIASCVGLVDLIIAERTDGSVREDRYAFEVACSRGDNATACSVLGLALLEGESLKKDPARARALLKQSCVDKTSPARPCFVLGDLYETGAGGERDRTLASTYYRWACAQGWGEACDRRGDLLDSGVGVREDDAEAVASYQLGCDAGFPNACYKAGVILDEGTNIPRDAKRALGLYTLGCEKGVGDACLRLGRLHVEGAAGEKDEAAARDAFEKAVALNNVEAHRRLARLLWNGLGGKKDKKRAKALCAAGCQADDPIACRGPDWQTEGSN
ncbi:MAG: hypothetical protein R3F61_35125 [Myxococcota bacterium]